MAGEVRLVMTVRFRTRLDRAELERRYRARMAEFRALPGLVQKYYVYDEASAEWGGVYLWASEEALQAYLASDLRRSIASVYEVEGTPRVETSRVVEPLRP